MAIYTEKTVHDYRIIRSTKAIQVDVVEEVYKDGVEYDIKLHGNDLGSIYIKKGKLVFYWNESSEEKVLIDIDDNGFVSSEVITV